MNKKCFEHNCVNFSDRSKCVKERRAVTDGNPDWVTSIQFKPFFSPSARVSETRFLQQLTWTYQLDRPSNVAIRSYRKGYQMPSVSNSTRRIRRKGRKSIINFMCMHRLICLLTWREKMLLFFVKRCAVDKTKGRDEKTGEWLQVEKCNWISLNIIHGWNKIDGRNKRKKKVDEKLSGEIETASGA